MSSVKELVDEALKPSGTPRVRSGKYSPSSFGKCFRSQYWNRKNEPQTNPPEERAMRIFKCGKLFHDFIQGVLTEKNPDIKTEVLVETDDIKGFADIVLGDEVVDLKSVHSSKFHYLIKAKDVRESEKPHFLQVMLYVMLLNKKQGRIVYISKDDLSFQEYVYDLEGYWKTEVEKELNTLKSLWEKGELPEAKPRAYFDKDGKSKECEYCSFKDKCFKLQKENISG